MAFTIRIRDLTSAELQRATGILTPANLALAGARGVANKLRDHFRELQTSRPNKKGFPRQNFWASARANVQVPDTISGPRAVVSINKPGVALHYFGSLDKPIRPLEGRQFLTIPAVPEAYGKRAREWSDLIVGRQVNPETGREQWCLIEAEQTKVKLGKANKITGVRKFRGKKAGGRVIYWLAKEVKIRPDPTVIPSDAELEQAAGSGVADALLAFGKGGSNGRTNA